MSFINHTTKEINCKVLYYGCGLSGKTTNVQYIYDQVQPDHKGKMVTLSSDNERTLFFDFLPLSIGEVKGFQTRFHLYTIPGQTFYEVSRQFIIKGVDGVVFVVDSDPERMDANIESFEELEKNLLRQGYRLDQLPIVFQYNKRDLPNAVLISELQATFNARRYPYFEAQAQRGIGVMETLQEICQRVIKHLKGVPS